MAATVLVIDGGGRGSALVAKYLQSPHVSKVLAVPGNDLMPVKTFQHLKTTDIKDIKKICKIYKVDLVDVTQDDAVAAGVGDQLQKVGVTVFGPTKLAGQIEWDKAWARNFAKLNQIPTPTFKICKSRTEGIRFINSQKEGEWFIKASGLAAGKGALHAANNRQAIECIDQMVSFGTAGKTYLIEECLKGEEFSSFAIVDAQDLILVGHAQDHKTVYDNDQGPNTGGMGCSSPPLVITPKIEKQINSIFQKTTAALAKIGRPYRGILYLGGMIDKNGRVFVIEFNARWGDPEAQVIIPSIKNDFYEIATLVTSGQIEKLKVEKDNLYRVVVTAASRGYPTDYNKVVGKQIYGLAKLLKKPGDIQIFGAGVKVSGKKFTAHGGRLFYIMASGKNVVEARQKAYSALSKISIEGNNLHYRTDIGWRDFERMRNPEKSRRIKRL